MPPTVRLRSRRQTTGPQSSPRLLKRPGERPRVAKPQPSEQGMPPPRKPGAKPRSRRSERQQRRRGSKPSSERSVKLPRSRSATLREKPSARRRGRQSAKPLRKRRSRLPNARNARRRRRRSVKPPARSSAKRPRRQSEKLPGSRRWRLPNRQNAKLRRRSGPSARRLNEQNARPPNRYSSTSSASAFGSLEDAMRQRTRASEKGNARSHSGGRWRLGVIQQAVWLYFRFALSYRDVENMLAERGIDVSYETVRRWALKFGGIIARRLRRGRPGRTGGGSSMKCSSPSTADSCTSGAPWTAK